MQAQPSAGTFALARAWQGYLGRLQTNPVMTKAITSALLSVVSDLVAKGASKTPVKSSSLINELSMGLVIRGPVVHYFHTFLDKVVFRKTNQSSPAVVIGKLALDQVIFAPLYTALYFFITGAMEDMPVAQTRRKVSKMLLSVMKSNWTVWVPVNLVSYALIPLELRVLFGNIVSIFWTAFLIRKVKGSARNSNASAPHNDG
mmetsp:Transcript_13115/g.32387  ORF Transcript_13115/g.32387 Transcript_13115/m.32387 type:complete len:202 (+) Transcript_13115:101-706(+)